MPRPTHVIATILATFLFAGSASAGQDLELVGTLRDFKIAHGDMEYTIKSFGLRTGIVQSQLGADGLPVLNPSYSPLSKAMITTASTFNEWYRDVVGVNESFKHTIVLTDPDDDGVYRFERSIHNGNSFFPLDGQGYGNEGKAHNYHFTYNIHSKFTYTDPASRDNEMVFSFSGDDDVWVFINGKLVVDLGGVHAEVYGSVNVDNVAEQLGLVAGQTYDFDFFFAERHTTQSNFTIETTIQFLSPLYD